MTDVAKTVSLWSEWFISLKDLSYSQFFLVLLDNKFPDMTKIQELFIIKSNIRIIKWCIILIYNNSLFNMSATAPIYSYIYAFYIYT